MSSLGLVLGNHLFEPKYFKKFPEHLFMCEDLSLCTHFKYHKQKILHFLVSMREFCDLMSEKNFKVSYYKLAKQDQFFQKLQSEIKKHKIKDLHCFEIEDKFFETEIQEFCNESGVSLILHQNPMFVATRQEFRDYLADVKKPLMASFYKRQRIKHNVLMLGDLPKGGEWSYDKENRKKIPKKFEVLNYQPPAVQSAHREDVTNLIEKYFSGHPGTLEDFWIPVNRKQALKQLKKFLEVRLEYFGPYQDALDERAPFLYHSLISPSINIGHLTPLEVVKSAEKYLNKENISSVEGFIRQVLGWREFVRGIYQNFDDEQQTSNFFKHKRKLKPCWYSGTTGIEPVDQAIRKALKYGYCHHIERLMVLSNLMLLLEVHPQEVYKWFMELFVDSSDWVMGPNIFGMGQFSDGGVFATKPYISGSNYILKMSHYKKGDWCDGVDGLYWQFIEKKKEFFAKNHRMSMMVRSLEKMDSERKKLIFKAADKLRNQLTH